MKSPALRRALWAAAGLLLLGGAAGLALSRSQQPPAAAAPVALEFAAADVVRVESRELSRSLPLTGTLRPLAEAVVKAKVAGELQALGVREGERVRRGQVLGQIDATEYRARLAQQQAEVAGARAQLDMAGKNRATQRALLERNFISKNAYDGTESNFEVARARLAAAEAAAAVAAKSLQDTRLTAPMDGIVSARHAHPGERVAVDGRVLTIVDLTQLEMTAAVPAADIGAVREGQSLRFAVEGLPGREFTGRVERINPTAAPGERTIDLYVTLDNPDGSLRGGLFAQGRLTLERHAAAIAVPHSAVREEAGQTYVYAIENGTLVKRAVRLGEAERDSGMVQIAEGLAPGALVVRSNLGRLREGLPARVNA